MIYETNNLKEEKMDVNLSRIRATAFMRGELYNFVQDPLWYTKFGRFNQARLLGVTAVGNLVGSRSVQYAARASRERLYELLSDLLEHDEVALGLPGRGLYEFDSEREDIDTVVFHHSNRAKGIRLDILNAMELIRLYVPAYAAPSPDDAPRLRGKPIYSGHFWGGQQSFFPYHWIIRQDGTSRRLLEDHQIGWHCGNWSVNKRSIAICFDDDLSHKAPNAAMLREGRRILREEYGWLRLNADTVQGHSDFSDTLCPGDQFTAGANWKVQLVV